MFSPQNLRCRHSLLRCLPRCKPASLQALFVAGRRNASSLNEEFVISSQNPFYVPESEDSFSWIVSAMASMGVGRPSCSISRSPETSFNPM